MTNVLIQPSFGSAAARAHYADTLDKEINFAASPYRETLTDDQFAQLLALHPTGLARFWGAGAGQDAKMARLSTGDFVLFTGGNLVRAIGEVGVTLRNAAFADELWDPDDSKGSWLNVYSVRSFKDPLDIGYPDLASALGYKRNWIPQGFQLLAPDKAEKILTGFGVAITVDPTSHAAPPLDATATAKGGVTTAGGTTLLGTSYMSTARTIEVTFVEAKLVDRFDEWLGASATISGLKTKSGKIADRYVHIGDHYELVEAKSDSSHHYVRQALAQLLFYACDTDEPVTHLVALFPNAPSVSDVAWLNRYGIDVMHPSATGFSRTDATEENRAQARAVWSAE